MFSREAKPFVIPFLVFMLLLLVVQAIDWIFKGHGPLFIAEPQYWVYPAQTVITGALVVIFWRSYRFGSFRRPILTFLIAILVLIIWVSPQAFLGFEPRTSGFDPTTFADDPVKYYGNLAFRFLRLVVVVPLVEEVFWRGFLLRYLIDDDFQRVPVGAFSWSSFLWVTVLFGLEHSGPDLVAALITGAAFNAVAYWTRSLTACVVAHAVTNLGLGIYILATRQWGFW